MTTATLPLRFADKVDFASGSDCWLWTGAVTDRGYGSIWGGETMRYAHRIAYEAFVGPIPPGKQLDHLCRVRHCVNPAHLEPVTPRENTLRGEGLAARNAAKTHCPRGHPLAGDNLYLAPKTGFRGCRTCRREAAKETKP